jgi:hypothetical protein
MDRDQTDAAQQAAFGGQMTVAFSMASFGSSVRVGHIAGFGKSVMGEVCEGQFTGAGQQRE